MALRSAACLGTVIRQCAILNAVLKAFTTKLDEIDLDDVIGEAVFIAVCPGFLLALLLFAGVPFLWALVLPVLIYAGHLWNSGFGG